MHQRDQNSTSTHQFTSSSNSSKNISFWLRWLCSTVSLCFVKELSRGTNRQDLGQKHVSYMDAAMTIPIGVYVPGGHPCHVSTIAALNRAYFLQYDVNSALNNPITRCSVP